MPSYISDNARAKIDPMLRSFAQTEDVLFDLMVPRASAGTFNDQEIHHIRTAASGNKRLVTIGDYTKIVPSEVGEYVEVTVDYSWYGHATVLSNVAAHRNRAAGGDKKFDYTSVSKASNMEDLVELCKDELREGTGAALVTGQGKSMIGLHNVLPADEGTANSTTYLGIAYSGNAFWKPGYISGTAGPSGNFNADWVERFQKAKLLSGKMRGGMGSKKASKKYVDVALADENFFARAAAMMEDKVQRPVSKSGANGGDMISVGYNHDCIEIAGVKVYRDPNADAGVIRFLALDTWHWKYDGTMFEYDVVDDHTVYRGALVETWTPRWQFYCNDPARQVVMTDAVFNA